MKESLTMSDLAQYGNPVSQIFRQPAKAEEWEPYILSKEQVQFYETYGFVSGIKILSDEQVDLLNKELETLQTIDEEKKKLFYYYESNESENPDNVLFHAIGAWRVTPGFHDLIWSPAYRMAAYQLLGRPFRLFHDQLFCKPVKHGGVVSWHQDFSYWTFTKPMHHITCWIGLDDATKKNGCLYYVPGSHRWGLLPITGLAGDMDAVRKVLSDEQNEVFDEKVANELPRGYASFHHPLMMHGSYANYSGSPRRAVVLNAMDSHTMGNTVGYERMDALRNFPPMPQDQLLNSNFFPILFEADEKLALLDREIPKVDAASLYTFGK